MTERTSTPGPGDGPGTVHRLVPSVGSCRPRVPPLGYQRLRLTLGGVFPPSVHEADAPTMTMYAYPTPPIHGVEPTWRGLREGSVCRIGPWSVHVESITAEPAEAIVRVIVEADGAFS